MQKPEGYEEARAQGEYERPELGGHFATIKKVQETKSSTGLDMVVVFFDFMNPDKQAGYFMSQYKADDREEKKWPFAGKKYILVRDYNDNRKTSGAFKGFCTSFEDSNNATINWNAGDKWPEQFKGKKIGVVFGEEENEYDGRIFMRATPKWFCGWDKVKDAAIPKPKMLKKKSVSTSADGFLQIPDGIEDEIPF